MQKIRRATLVVALAVSGLASGGSGIVFAGDRGATASDGFSVTGDLFQQNTAQEHRQNNNCSNPNTMLVHPELTGGGRTATHCATGDASFNKHTVIEGGGGHATGGSGVIGLFRQNTAQEGRQNNNCADPNISGITVAGGGRADNHCVDQDGSRNKHTLTKGGGAEATGGPGVVGHLVQQNTAQEGRQNNNCANPNDTFLTLRDAGVEARCATIDHSTNVDTAEISDGAEATGGPGVLGHLVQQNTAQEGRQNNNCANRNGMTLIASGSTQTQCVAVDNSKNIDSVYR